MGAGTIVASGSLVSPGGQQGVPGPNAVSADAGNQATFGSDARIYVPDPTPVITSVRLRSFNAIGNPTFEVDQRNAGVSNSFAAGTSSGFGCDRWGISKVAATATLQSIQANNASGVKVPSTNFLISRKALNIQLTAVQASLAAGEYIQVTQQVEGPLLRELLGDVHSISILALCTQAPITFSIRLTTPGSPYYTLTKTCTISTANQYTLFTLPNLPLWTASGTWSMDPGTVGYTLGIGLGAGTTYTSPANDTWQSGNFVCGPGTTNFASLALNSVFQIVFVQHEPGALCTTLIDKPFTQNLSEAQRYFAKSLSYSTKPGSTGQGACGGIVSVNTTWASGGWAFPVSMAKTPPTLSIYAVNGTLSSVTPVGGGSGTISGSGGLNEKGWSLLSFSPALPVSTAFQFDYAADTFW